jgi:hypothetical protein
VYDRKACQRIHLGKHTTGWDFTFRAYPLHSGMDSVTWEVKDLASWKKLLTLGEIRDEYGQVLTFDEMMAVLVLPVTRKHELYGHDWYEDGHYFLDNEFS